MNVTFLLSHVEHLRCLSRQTSGKSALVPEQQKILKYLAPLDGWFSIVIYPSISTKNSGQSGSSEVRKLIESIKQRKDHAHHVEGLNWPIEVNLDSCQNF